MMEKYQIRVHQLGGNAVEHEIEADAVTVADGVLHLWNEGENVFSEDASRITSLTASLEGSAEAEGSERVSIHDADES
jgi:hypothetical protein